VRAATFFPIDKPHGATAASVLLLLLLDDDASAVSTTTFIATAVTIDTISPFPPPTSLNLNTDDPDSSPGERTTTATGFHLVCGHTRKSKACPSHTMSM